jgi:hypothetical protein
MIAPTPRPLRHLDLRGAVLDSKQLMALGPVFARHFRVRVED